MNKTEVNIIISLTSFPKRIDSVSEVVKSLLNQTVLPEKIILWLAKNQFPNKEQDLPVQLLNLRNDIFNIMWCNDIRSYKKLIPTLHIYKNKSIVTCDDDIIYEKNRLELLYQASKKYPNDILCHRAHYITLNKKHCINNYSLWIKECFGELYSFNIFPTTGGMVLYPPNSFYKDVTDEQIFMSICKDTDDIWFWAMCVLNNKKPRLIKNNINNLNILPKTQNYTLWEKNITGGNDNNLKNILEKYPVLSSRLTAKKPFNICSFIFSIKKRGERIDITIMGIKIHLRGKNAKN